jgi:PAS domain S-box-containing protein
MAFSLSDCLLQNREDIISLWVDRLKKEAGDQYARRSRKELLGTITQAFEANYHLLVHNDYARINTFINIITRMRLEAGFLLSDVQKAFELFRTIVMPILAAEATLDEFSDAVHRINHCLYYTIHRFSEYFQSMHEKKILEHNRHLEAEVKARTKDLQASELKYKTLVEEINDGYFVVQDDAIVFANQAFCRMHGYDQKDIIGNKFSMFVAPESREQVMETFHRGIAKEGQSWSFEYMRLTMNKKTYPTECLSKTAHYDFKLSIMGICRDITDRVKMETKIRESERMAYIGQITTSLSHEIRNPLSAVKMNLQILKKNPQITGNDQRRIDISAREVNRLEGILKELLDFAKPLKIKREKGQLNDLLSTSIDLLEMKFREENMNILVRLDPRMPKMMIDCEKMVQAFINILLNALEASPAEATIEITSAFEPDTKQAASVVIADQGAGVSEEHLADIFKPFFTTKSKGTGLGLSNAHRIIEAHNGRIEVANRNPRGAYFKVLLPVSRP